MNNLDDYQAVMLAQRDAYLRIIDEIERALKITPRTAELRRQNKYGKIILTTPAERPSVRHDGDIASDED